MDCEYCGKMDDDKPMAFKGEKWCCELHRKYLVAQEKGLEVAKAVVE